MRITSTRDLGLHVRATRQRLGQTQAELAAAANVSRRWLSDLEAGKSTAEIGLVLQTLSALGLVLDAQPDAPAPGQIDLDEHLRRLGGPQSDVNKTDGHQ
jgi:y4mF family transcriptional regulator